MSFDRTIEKKLHDFGVFIVRTLCLYCIFIGTASAQLKEHFSDFVEFQGSVLLSEKRGVSQQEYPLPLGTLKRNKGRAEPKKKQILLGQVHRLIYEVGRDYTPETVFNHYYGYFKAQKFNVLFECAFLECGSNSDWANKIFKQRVLNGFDDSQHYVAFYSANGGIEKYVVLYFVQGGSKKNFIYLDLIVPVNTAINDTNTLAPLLNNGFVWLPGVRFSDAGILDLQASQNELNAVITWLQKNPDRKIAVVGHTHLRPDVNAALVDSKNAAEQLVAYVTKQVNSTNLNAYSVGPLAPSDATKNQSFCVQLILLP